MISEGFGGRYGVYCITCGYDVDVHEREVIEERTLTQIAAKLHLYYVCPPGSIRMTKELGAGLLKAVRLMQ